MDESCYITDGSFRAVSSSSQRRDTDPQRPKSLDRSIRVYMYKRWYARIHRLRSPLIVFLLLCLNSFRLLDGATATLIKTI